MLKDKIHFKLGYFAMFMLLLCVEIYIAIFIKDAIIRPFVGDILVMFLMYFFIKTFIRVRSNWLPLWLLVFAVLVEVSQAFSLVDLLGLGNNTVARIVMGTSFDWHDIFCYAVGSGVLLMYEKKAWFLMVALFASNGSVAIIMANYMLLHKPLSIRISAMVCVFIGVLVAFIWLQFIPVKTDIVVSKRLKILRGGRRLIALSYSILIINIIMFFVFDDLMRLLLASQIEAGFIVNSLVNLSVNMAGSIIVALILYTNGYIRVALTSRKLGVSIRILCVVLMYTPFVQLGLSIYLRKVARDEFDHECYKINTDKIRVTSSICKTKYPVLLLHGVGFRDFKYVNYWGRIPNELIKNGATIYYGHQEAWGTIEDNALAIKDKIHEILAREGCEKVNIIAHSKGGLDARYVVSQLDMGQYIGSLTMVGTPHRGSEVLEFAYKLPTKLIIFIGNQINRHYKVIGDKNPNFHRASKQFLIEEATAFNQEVLDDEGVYYQSYASKMKTPLSDLLLMVPYCIVRKMGGPNDGLVTVESAKWGDFKGVITTTYNRGISHGDTIDLKREEVSGFDVREFYVQMLHELKKMNY